MSPKLSQQEKVLLEKEISKMLNKGAIVEIQHVKGDFLSNLTHVNKKDEVNRPKINLKNLNELLPYKHLKTEGLHCLRNVLKK